MTVFLIGPEDGALLKAAVERARTKPVDLTTVVKHGRMAGAEAAPLKSLDLAKKELPPVEMVELPFGHTVCINFERQPPGLVFHLSVSGPQPGRAPHPIAIQMVMEAVGMTHGDHVWLEEYENDRFAVNVLQLVEPDPSYTRTEH